MSEVKMKIKIGYNYLHLTDKKCKNQLISNNRINGCDFQDLKAHSMDKKNIHQDKAKLPAAHIPPVLLLITF